MKKTIYSNRGIDLEKRINNTNDFYRVHNMAIIYKKPTPITVVKVDYKSRQKATITEAYYKTPSTTDYNGIYKGLYIDFEVKQVKSKTSFPFSNIHNHQVTHLYNVYLQGGISFIIVEFIVLSKVFLLETSKFYNMWKIQCTNRKSIPLDFFEQWGYEITLGYGAELDYLRIIKKLKTINQTKSIY